MIRLGVCLTLVFLYSLVSKRALKTIITAPIVFTTAGLIMVFILPELSQVEIQNKTILVIGEITLAVVLFADATRISLRKVRRESQLPGRLLGIGMPLTIMAGTLVALLIFTEFSLWEAAILATILAPTDASLGSAVVNSKRVPARIRQALNVESGLNDGLSVPLLMLFVALARVESPGEDTSWFIYTAQQIGFGLLVGAGLGFLGGWLIRHANRRDWISKGAQQLALLSLALLSWWLAEKVLHGNGFIAAFTAGAMVQLGFENARERMIEYNEAWEDILIYFVFFFFGMLAAQDLLSISLPIWVYAILSLTLVRMLPVGISMIRSRLHISSVLFLGWFGPRGLASIVLGLIFLAEKADLPGESLIVLTVIATVLLSVFAHGISSAPAINVYARQVEAMPPDALECQETEVTEF
jgi:NhaP-type Na+/H+ or K+/H+ antiporter